MATFGDVKKLLADVQQALSAGKFTGVKAMGLKNEIAQLATAGRGDNIELNDEQAATFGKLRNQFASLQQGSGSAGGPTPVNPTHVADFVAISTHLPGFTPKPVPSQFQGGGSPMPNSGSATKPAPKQPTKQTEPAFAGGVQTQTGQPTTAGVAKQPASSTEKPRDDAPIKTLAELKAKIEELQSEIARLGKTETANLPGLRDYYNKLTTYTPSAFDVNLPNALTYVGWVEEEIEVLKKARAEAERIKEEKEAEAKRRAAEQNAAEEKLAQEKAKLAQEVTALDSEIAVLGEPSSKLKNAQDNLKLGYDDIITFALASFEENLPEIRRRIDAVRSGIDEFKREQAAAKEAALLEAERKAEEARLAAEREAEEKRLAAEREAEQKRLAAEKAEKLEKATNDVSSTEEKDIAKLSPERHVDLMGPLAGEIKDLKKQLKGQTGQEKTRLENLVKERQEVINKLYRSVPLDPKFADPDRKQRNAYLGELLADEELVAASQPGAWTRGDPRDSDKAALLQSAVDKQFASLFADLKKKVDGKLDILFPDSAEHFKDSKGNLKPPQIVTKVWPDAATDKQKASNAEAKTCPQGYYDANIHQIVCWTFKGEPPNKGTGTLDNFQEAINTAVHEATHGQQNILIALLNAGEIKKGDPEFEQATLFKLNQDAYYSGKDNAAYKGEPMEKHAWLAGDTAGNLFNANARILEAKTEKLKAATAYPQEKAKLDGLDKAIDAEKSKKPFDAQAVMDAVAALSDAAKELNAKAAAEKKRQEEEAAAEKKRQDEAAAAEKKRQEEAAAAERKRLQTKGGELITSMNEAGEAAGKVAVAGNEVDTYNELEEQRVQAIKTWNGRGDKVASAVSALEKTAGRLIVDFKKVEADAKAYMSEQARLAAEKKRKEEEAAAEKKRQEEAAAAEKRLLKEEYEAVLALHKSVPETLRAEALAYWNSETLAQTLDNSQPARANTLDKITASRAALVQLKTKYEKVLRLNSQ